MMAWADELAAQRRRRPARYLAARLREFRNPLAKDWRRVRLPAKARAALPVRAAARPYQCGLPRLRALPHAALHLVS
jgi:hypothetical protein